MPNPSQVTAQNINTELGVPTTSNIPMSNNWLKNVACVDVTSNSNINFGKLRWGINFPGGYQASIFDSSVNSYSKTYNTTANLTLYAQDFAVGAASANASISLNTNGVLVLTTTTGTGITYNHHVTWLTSGANTDYTANLYVSSGSIAAPAGSSVNTDLGLGTTREWSVFGAVVGDGYGTGYANCELIIKSGGVLINRNVILQIQFDSVSI